LRDCPHARVLRLDATGLRSLQENCHVLELVQCENYFTERAIQLVKGERFHVLGPFERLKDADPAWSKNENWRICRPPNPGGARDDGSRQIPRVAPIASIRVAYRSRLNLARFDSEQRRPRVVPLPSGGVLCGDPVGNDLSRGFSRRLLRPISLADGLARPRLREVSQGRVRGDLRQHRIGRLIRDWHDAGRCTQRYRPIPEEAARVWRVPRVEAGRSRGRRDRDAAQDRDSDGQSQTLSTPSATRWQPSLSKPRTSGRRSSSHKTDRRSYVLRCASARSSSHTVSSTASTLGAGPRRPRPEDGREDRVALTASQRCPSGAPSIETRMPDELDGPKRAAFKPGWAASPPRLGPSCSFDPLDALASPRAGLRELRPGDAGGVPAVRALWRADRPRGRRA
jgi:hypothetical protein